MAENEITIIRNIKGSRGLSARVYYYQGNIFMPMTIHGGDISRVKKAIMKFIRDNRELIAKDRSDPGYMSLAELAQEQMRGIDHG